ncbi:MAG: 6-bladed beta-propeller [Massilibacteroides sp.]|nr:6-bladed beta-propeller [Massilibacteroides sp.]
MKRTFIGLLLILSALYLKEGYSILTSDGTQTCLFTGFLSDIGEEVVAIPLQKSKEHHIHYAKHVRKTGKHLFLICNETLYHFNRNGEFLQAITRPEEMRVGGYIVDESTSQLIVLGNNDDIFYYTFEGILLEKKKLKDQLAGERICSLAIQNQEIWTTQECVTYNPDTNQTCIEVMAIKYNTDFRPLECKKIISSNLGREESLTTNYENEFCIDHNGALYLYAPPCSAEYLLQDTLYLLNQPRQQQADYITKYPARTGNRFWIASYQRNPDPSKNYLFCHDTVSHKTWQLSDGFEDNYYHTGNIKDLHSIELDNDNYYYCQSGNALTHSFPQEAKSGDLVLFMVKLKA